MLLETPEHKRTSRQYRLLLSQVQEMVELIKKERKYEVEVPLIYMESLIGDAEFALSSGDVLTAVSRYEVLLSTVHKFLLQFAPHATGLPKDVENASVLIVEDEFLVALEVQDGVREAGIAHAVVERLGTALTALVEKKFDLLWVDLNLNGEMAYRLIEVAKRIDPDVKIIVCTGYTKRDLPGSLDKLIDLFLPKPVDEKDIANIVLKVLNG